jgi:hypothetical protein
VARAKRDEIPGSLIDLFIGKRFQPRGDRSSFLDAGVLGVDLMDGTVQRSDGGERVGPHPQQVAWVEVGADGVPDSLTQS